VRLIQDNLYLELDDFVRLGYTAGTVKTNISDQRTSWRGIVTIRDPEDRRKPLYEYTSLPQPKRAEVLALTDGEDPISWAQKREHAAVLRQYLPVVPKKDLETLRNYRIQRETADLSTGEVLTKTLSGLPEDKVMAYAQACRWLALLSDPRWKKKEARMKVSKAFEKMPAFQAACIELFKADGVKLPTDPSKLAAKVRAYKEEGAACLVSKALGNNVARKVHEEQLEYLIKLMSDPRKPSYELVTAWYNEAARHRATLGLELWPEIQSNTVKNNLEEPDVKPVWYLARHGRKAYKDKYEYTMLRHRPGFRDALWVVDGTKVNYYYKTAKGVAAKLQVIAVIDAHSDYWLGWTFCEQENADAVGQALRMALRTAGGVKPWQVQYDNDRANLKFFAGWAGLHFPAMPNNGQSKVIERAFGALQQRVMRRHHAFTGQNITAVSLNGKAKPEQLKQLLKEGALLSLEETIREASLDFDIWNNLKCKKDGKTPKERYLASQHPETAEYFTAEDEVEAFWTWNAQAIQYRRNGLTMQQGRERHLFEVVTEVEGDVPGTVLRVPDLDFHMSNVGVNFWVKYDPEQNPPQRIALFKGADKRFVAWADNKEAMPGALVDYQSDSREAIKHRLNAKKAQEGRLVERLDSIEERLDAEEMLKLGHSHIPKDALNAAEADHRAREEAQPVAVKRPARVKVAALASGEDDDVVVTIKQDSAIQNHYLNMVSRFDDEE
jgi:hypothetical protein